MVGVDDHHEPLQRDGGEVQDCRRGGENSEIFGNLAEDSGLIHLDREVVEELGGDGDHHQEKVGHLQGGPSVSLSLLYLIWKSYRERQEEQIGLPGIRV